MICENRLPWEPFSKKEIFCINLVFSQITEDYLPLEVTDILNTIKENNDWVALFEMLIPMKTAVLSKLIRESPLFQSLLCKFCTYVSEQDWSPDWDFVRKVLKKCDELYVLENDAEIKAQLLIAIMFIGLNHNEFSALKTLRKRMCDIYDGEEVLRIGDILRPYKDYLEEAKVESHRLNPILRQRIYE